MKIGIISTLMRVHRLGRAMHPGLTLNSLKHQFNLLGLGIKFLPEIRQWYLIADNPMLALALKRYPLISGAMYWPYINHTWPMNQRLSAIKQHYRILSSTTTILAHATFKEVVLASLEKEYSGLRLVLDKAMWFLREGEIVLNLFVDNQRFYSVAFTLGTDSGEPLMFVGALQGSNADTAQDVYRNITHALQGMRPRDLLLLALKMLCTELGIHRIWAISGEMRQHNSPYFGNSHKEKVLVSYNQVWLEHGGKALENGFFEIPATVNFKNMDEIPSRKRASYRRRYQILDQLMLDIRSACNWHKNQALEFNTTIQTNQ